MSELLYLYLKLVQYEISSNSNFTRATSKMLKLKLDIVKPAPNFNPTYLFYKNIYISHEFYY